MSHARNYIDRQCFSLGIFCEICAYLILFGEDLSLVHIFGDNKEFVSSHPDLDTVFGDHLRDRLGNAVDSYITDRMSVCIVKDLEIVKIDIDEIYLAVVL